MLQLPEEQAVLFKLTEWGASDDSIRAVVLTSSRTRPGAYVDILSDYDVMLFVKDVERYAHQTDWYSRYGTPMVVWGDQCERFGCTTYFRGVIYEDHIKVDYNIWPDVL